LAKINVDAAMLKNSGQAMAPTVAHDEDGITWGRLSW
jgi:hypothetical protein